MESFTFSPNLVGAMASSLTTLSFAFQVVHTWKTRDVSGISLPMYLVFVTGVSLWLVYGVMNSSWAIVTGNAITLSLAGTVLAMKIRSLFTKQGINGRARRRTMIEPSLNSSCYASVEPEHAM